MTDDFAGIFNLIEGFVWIAFSVGFWVSLVRPGQRWAKGVAGVNFAAFGVSDFVEMQTGSWGRPWWLAAWKIACVGVMAVQVFLYTRRKRAEAAAGKEKR